MKITTPQLITMVLIVLIIVFLLSPFFARFLIYRSIKSSIYSFDDVPDHKVAIVFGAGLNRIGQPTTVLRDRVEIAALLYKKGKVAKLLFSGDNRTDNYNEPLAMQNYAISLSVPKEAIVLDYGGRRTYDTCYRAKVIFGVDEAILVTQSFHLPRALFTCQKIGIAAVGVSSNVHFYKAVTQFYWNLRETMATINALIDLNITHPKPLLGKPEPIFPKEMQ
ncbi:MAG: SanA/YdcF family protein [Anaerolineales bacterium]